MSAPQSRWSALLFAAMLAAPGAASAKSVAVANLLARSGANSKQATQATQLISSELDFMVDFDEVIEASGPTNTSCLTQTGCLRGLANKAGADTVITGAIAVRGENFVFDLVYYDNSSGRIVRQQSFTIDSSPESVADGMNAIVSELLSGKSEAEVKEEENVADDFDFDLGEGDDFAFEAPDPQAERRAAEAEARRKQQEEAARRQQEEARRQEAARRAAEEEARRRQEAEARARAEEEARQHAAAEARRRQEAEAARRAAEERERAAPVEFDPSMISFGAVDEDDITIDDIDTAIQFAAPSSGSVYVEAEDDFDPDYVPPTRGGYDDLDDIDPPSRSRDTNTRDSKPPRSSTERTKPTSDPSEQPVIELKLHAGYARYWSMAFVAYGGEIHKSVAGGLNVVVGFGAYSVEREIPEQLQEQLQAATQWNTIFPFNAGLVYKLRNRSSITPYIGGDVLLAQYYVDNVTGETYFSKGGRGRGGFDIRLTPPESFGASLNVDVALGGWAGEKWTTIDSTVGPQGFLPQITGGLLLSF